MAASRDVRLADIANKTLHLTKFTGRFTQNWFRVDRDNEAHSFWLQYNEFQDFGRLYSVPDNRNTNLFVLSHDGADFFFHQQDFYADDMIILEHEAGGVDTVQQLLVFHKITSLEFRVYHTFKHYGNYDPISVWEARTETKSRRVDRPILIFSCRMVHLASVLDDVRFGRLAVEMINVQFQHKTIGLTDIENMTHNAPHLDNLVKDRIN